MANLEALDLIAQEDETVVTDQQGQPVAAQSTAVEAAVAPPELSLLEAISEEDEALPEGSGLQNALDVGASITNALVTTPISGLIGILATPIVGAEKATEVINAIQQFGNDIAQPQTEGGKRALQNLGQVIEPLEDITQAFVGGAAAIPVALTQGPEAGVAAVEGSVEEGVGQTFGDIVFEATGSPVAGAAVSAIPQATADLLGLKGTVKIGKVAKPLAKEGLNRIASGVDNVLKNLLDEVEVVFIDEAGKITPEGLAIIKQLEAEGADISKLDNEIKSQLEAEGILTSEQAARFNLFQKRGVQPIRSQVTQKGEDFIISQELAKGTNPISEILASQDEALEAAARSGQESIGATTSNIGETNANIFQTIDNVIGSAEKLTTEAYTAAKEVAGANKVVNTQSFLDELKSNVGKEQISKGLISSIRQDLINKGVIGKNDKTFKGLGKIDVNQAEEIRQSLNRQFESTSAEGRIIINDLKQKLDLDVEDAVGADVFADARAAKIELERLKRKEKRDVRDRSKGTLLTDILENKIPEEKIFSKILTARDDEFLHMKDFLLNDSGPQGIQAWQNMKAQVLGDAIDKAVSTRGKVEGGGSAFKGNIFDKQFAGMRKTKKYEELFNEAERALIEDIAEIDFLRAPKTGTFTGKGPSAQAVQELTGEVAELGIKSRAAIQLLNLVTLGATGKAGLNSKSLLNRAKNRAEKNSKKAETRETERQVDITKETE